MEGLENHHSITDDYALIKDGIKAPLSPYDSIRREGGWNRMCTMDIRVCNNSDFQVGCPGKIILCQDQITSVRQSMWDIQTAVWFRSHSCSHNTHTQSCICTCIKLPQIANMKTS